MSAINYLILFISFISLCSCPQKTDLSKHGMKAVPTSEFGYRGPVQRTIDLKFDLDKGSETTIQAIVSVPYSNQSPHRFEWRLGEGVELIQGDLKGSVLFEQNNKKQKIKIVVKGFDEKNIRRFVRFEIFGEQQSRPTFADGIVSSDQENSFEKIVQEVENYKKENSQ